MESEIIHHNNQNQQSFQWIGLPQEVWILILNFLTNTSEKFRVCLTCKKLFEIWKQPTLWHQVSLENQRKSLNDSKLKDFLENNKKQLQSCQFLEIIKCGKLKHGPSLLVNYLPSTLNHLDLYASMESFKDEQLTTLFEHCTNLELVSLGANRSDGNFLNSLAKSKQLKFLTLFGFSRLSNVNLKKFFANVNDQLEHLNIRGTFLIEDDAFGVASFRLKSLKTIDIGLCSRLTEKSFRRLIENNTSTLESIRTRRAYGLTAKAFDPIAQCSKLKILDTCFIMDLDGAMFAKNVGPNLQLEELTVAECMRMDDKLIQNLNSSMKKLDLTNTNITDDGLKFIAKNCPQLERLDLQHCLNLNEDELVSSVCKMKNLKKLDALELPFSKKESIEKIIENCTSMKKLFITECEATKQLDPNKYKTPLQIFRPKSEREKEKEGKKEIGKEQEEEEEEKEINNNKNNNDEKKNNVDKQE